MVGSLDISGFQQLTALIFRGYVTERPARVPDWQSGSRAFDPRQVHQKQDRASGLVLFFKYRRN